MEIEQLILEGKSGEALHAITFELNLEGENKFDLVRKQ